jgi:transcriptional regulator with XRE-family HTH domain
MLMNFSSTDAVVGEQTQAPQPHPLDVELGRYIRKRRRELGLSQDQLGRMVGVTFQQVQKYEHGTNRVSFSRLVEIAQSLNCSVAELIGDLGNVKTS